MKRNRKGQFVKGGKRRGGSRKSTKAKRRGGSRAIVVYPNPPSRRRSGGGGGGGMLGPLKRLASKNTLATVLWGTAGYIATDYVEGKIAGMKQAPKFLKTGWGRAIVDVGIAAVGSGVVRSATRSDKAAGAFFVGGSVRGGLNAFVAIRGGRQAKPNAAKVTLASMAEDMEGYANPRLNGYSNPARRSLRGEVGEVVEVVMPPQYQAA